MNQALEQYNRVKRFLKRIEDQNRSSDDYDDDLWSFFQNCWHLKDWIKNDSGISVAISSQVESDIDKISSLRICADLANRSKHLTLTKHIREDAKVTGRNVFVKAPTLSLLGSNEDKKCESSCEHIITLQNGDQHKALDVARNAVVEWEKLLKHYGLLP